MNKHIKWDYLLVFIVHCTLIFYFLNPIFSDFTISTFGNGHSSDSGIYLWNTFNLQSGHIFSTDHALYPNTISLVFNTNTFFTSLINLIVNNPYLAVNISLIISFLGYGFGVFVLSKEILKNTLAALATSVVATYTLNHLVHLQQHFNLMLFFPVPYYIYYCLKSIQFDHNKVYLKSFKYTVHLALLFFISLLCDYQVAFFILFFKLYLVLAVCFVYLINKYGANILWGSVITFVVIHLILKKLIEPNHIHIGEGLWFTPDFLSFFIPTNYPYTNKIFEKINFSIHETGQPFESIPFIGFSVLFLFVFSIIYGIRHKLFYSSKSKVILLISIFFMITVFPQLKIIGEPVFYFPTVVTHILPFFKNLRCPGRFTTMMALFVPLTGFVLLRKFKLITSVLSIVVFIGFMLETPVRSYEKFYRKDSSTNKYLKTLDEESLFYIPVGVRDGSNAFGDFQMNDFLDQIEHKKKINNGYFSRLKPEVFDFYRDDLFYGDLVSIQKGGKPKPLSIDEAKYALNKFKVSTIVIRATANQYEVDSFIQNSFDKWITKRVLMDDNIIYHIASDYK